MKRPVLLLLSLLLYSALPAATAPELPPRIKAPTDQAVFHRFVLDNGLRVMLVSDPRFNLSAATLAVGIGALDDPANREGLVHFLEHMISKGNAKYPAADGLSDFVSANGGARNAATSSDHTYYLFQIRHDSLAEALDRTAQVFISPNFPADFTTREINAVHNEAMRHVQNDARRRTSVLRELYGEDSPERKFSTGNKDTLSGVTGADVRAFWEKTHSADRMTLAVAGKASIEELEKMVRGPFSAILRRELAPITREQKFLPRKAALRMAFIEPVREERTLDLEFPTSTLRADFVSKPHRLAATLLSHANPGGLEAGLKRDGLANGVAAFSNDRSSGYSSFTISISLTPAGEKDYGRVLRTTFSYLKFLQESPFPADLYQQQARIGQLNETYEDRGEGYTLTNKLASQMLAYPLAVAERATDAWGPPDEGAYRRLLGSLAADNMLVTLMAKGVPTDKNERIYHAAYSYREDSGAAYQALANPAKVAGFALPGANRFMPAAPAVLAERPLRLISEPGLELYYAQDTQFERPQTSLVVRLVGTRDAAGLEAEALLSLYNSCLSDFLSPAINEANRAGVSATSGATLSGLLLNVTGYGDSPVRYASYVAENLKSFSLSPERFEACKESTLRSLRSAEQNEAVAVSVTRQGLLAREFDYPAAELIPRVTSATWAEVQAFARRWFSRGKVEAVVHGHLSPEAAETAVRTLARHIGAQPADANALLRPKYLKILPGEDIVDAGPIEGVNSVFSRDVMLPDDSPATRAAAIILASFIRNPFFNELRSKQQLGYIVGSSAAATHRNRHLNFVIQSSVYPPDELRRRVDAFVPTLPGALAAVSPERWDALVAGARSSLEAKPKSIAERAARFHFNAFTLAADWEQRAATLEALDTLTKEQAVALLTNLLTPETRRSRTVLLWSKQHTLTEELKPAFTDRVGWKSTRKYE